MPYKLIAIDLDGTLLNGDRVVSRRNAEALGKAAEAGIRIMISSGRIYPEAELCVRHLNSVSLISACNGADIRDAATGTSLRTATMSQASCLEILKLLESAPLFYALYSRDLVYIEEARLEAFSGYKPYIEGRKARSVMVRDMRETVASRDLGICKFYMMSPDREAAARFRPLLEGYEGIEVTSSGGNNAEIMAAGVDKGKALAAVESLFGIRREEMMAFGDSENDLSMLGYAGFPIAMGNAEPRVLAAARAVTLPNTEDGVAAAIEKYALSGL